MSVAVATLQRYTKFQKTNGFLGRTRKKNAPTFLSACGESVSARYFSFSLRCTTAGSPSHL